MAERYELGQLLLMKGVITQQQLEESLLDQQKTRKFLGEILVEKGFVSKEKLLEYLNGTKESRFHKAVNGKGYRNPI